MASRGAGTLLVFVFLMAGCVSKNQFLQEQERVRALSLELEEVGGKLSESREVQETTSGSIRVDQADIKADLIDLRTEIQQLRGEVSSLAHQGSSEASDRQALEQSLAFQMNHILEQMRVMEARMTRIEDFFGLKSKAAPGAGKKERGPAGMEAAPPAVGSQPFAPAVPAPAAAPFPPSTTEAVAPEAPAPSDADPQAALTPPEPPPPPLSVEESYNMAYHLFRAREFEAARKAFAQFLERHPGSHLAENARFWIGETYYQTGDYERAIVLYQEVLQKNSKGSKSPDALLKMGFALVQMGEETAGAAALEKLLRDYPQAPQVKLAKEKLKLLKPKEEPDKAPAN